MKKYFLLLMIAISFTILISNTYAADESFTISADSDKNAVSPGDYITYDVYVYNTDTENRVNADIIVSGEYREWTTLSASSLELRAKGNSSFKLYISPTYGAPAKSYVYTIKIKSQTDSSKFSEKTINFYVSEKEEVKITTLKTTKEIYEPGEEVEVIVNLNNTGTLSANNYKLKIKADQEERTVDVASIKVGDQQTIIEKFTFDKYSVKGDLVIVASLLDKDSNIVEQESSGFTIEEKSVVKEEPVKSFRLVIGKVSITAKNEGNKEVFATIEETLLPIPFLYSFEKEPVVEGNKYSWGCDIAPGQSCTISYTVNYWVLILIAIIIIGATLILRYEIQKPYIHKRILNRGDVYSVHIEAKNKSRRALKDVIITDFVPSIVTIQGGFTFRPTKIRKKRGGTELIWKIGRMDPKDARIFSYKVKMALGVEGGYKLPAAEINATDEKGKEFSNKSIPEEFS